MKKDINSRNEINELMLAFYSKAMKDDVIGFYFTDVVQLDLVKHLPIIGDFWENVLFNTNTYSGNPMAVHHHLHSLAPFKANHFDRWVEIFCASVDELFAGDNAEKIKQRAVSIATIMKIKLVYGGVSK